jgi:5'-nucleotidase
MILFLGLFSTVQAKRLRVIHLNDLHSFFEGYPRHKRGGYARVKTQIDLLIAKSNREGVPYIVVDGGDWGEGNAYYYIENGQAALKSLDLLGVDAAVVGNHDYMFGENSLKKQLEQVNPRVQLLGANMIFTPEMGLDQYVRPEVLIKRGGLKVQIVGLTTSEIHFRSYLLPGIIENPIKIAKKIQRHPEADLTIALTHLGVETDKKLARKAKAFDLVVGGHSHTRIENILAVKQRGTGNMVPIVQTGAHGLAVGELLLDVKGPGEVKVLRYQLHDITEKLEEDARLKAFVDRAKKLRLNRFSDRWDKVRMSSDH